MVGDAAIGGILHTEQMERAYVWHDDFQDFTQCNMPMSIYANV